MKHPSFVRVCLVVLTIFTALGVGFQPRTAAATARAGSPPVFAGVDGRYIVAENTTTGTAFADIYATDADNDTLTYTLLNGPGFAVNASTGALSVTTPPLRSAGPMRTISVSVSDGTSTVTANYQVFITPAAAYAPNGVTSETYNAVNGGSVDTLRASSKYKNNTPDATAVVNQIWMTPGDRGENYGVRYRGYLMPSVSGSYRFWISSDDASEFWLSTSPDIAALSTKPLVKVNDWTSNYQWYKALSQQSDPVTLVKGQAYYFEAFLKEWGGAEHIAVAWQGPGMAAPVSGNTAAIIPQLNLKPANALADNSPPSQPGFVSVEKVTGSGVGLIWVASTDASGISKYVVARDGVPIALVTPSVGTYVRYTDPVTSGMHRYTVHAIDNAALASTVASVPAIDAAVAYSAYTAAIVNGDARLVTDPAPIYGLIRTAVTDENTRTAAFFDKAFNGFTSISYQPNSQAQLLGPSALAANRAFPYYRAKTCNLAACSGTVDMAVFGTTDTGTRFGAFSWYDAFSTVGATISTKSMISWILTGDGATAASSSGAIAILNDGNSTISTGLVSMGFATVGSISVCTVANMSSCFSGKKLIIVGSKLGADANAAVVADAVKAAYTAGTPILYVEDTPYYTNGTQSAVGALLGFETAHMQYFTKGLAEYANVSAVTALKTSLQASIYPDFLKVINHLEASDWSIDLTGCANRSCSGTAATYLTDEFYKGAQNFIYNRLEALDGAGTPLFSTGATENVPLKYAVLLADIFRRTIAYPIASNTATTSAAKDAFFKAYFADHAVVNLRTVNPAQPQLGSFSKPIRADVPRYTPTASFTTRSGSFSTAVGFYALPGETFTVTRTDASSAKAELYMNSLRSGSTHEMEEYTRPKFLSSAKIPLVKDQTMTVTSPYGGPIQLWLEGTAAAQNIDIQLTNVGEHPVWNGAATTDRFYELLNAGDYDWAEFLTPGFQVHSTRALMLETLTDPDWTTPEKLADVTLNAFYIVNYNMAGFTGPLLSVSPSVTALCTSMGWTCTGRDPHGITSMNHFNADQATCGYGCSGNPYDAWWAFSVLGWGDSHEMGHNIQALHLNDISGNKATGEVSNNIYPSHIMYYWNKTHPSRYRMASHELEQDLFYKGLNDAQNRADPKKAVNDTVWQGDTPTNSVLAPTEVNWGMYRLSFYLQLVQQARVSANAVMGDGGWDLVTMLYMHDRLLNANRWDATKWDAIKASLGMSNYTAAEAQAIDNNSLFLIRASWILKTDERPFFDLWGIYSSAKAEAQVASYGFPAAEKRYYYWAYDTTGLPQWSDDAIGSLVVDGASRTIPHVPMNYVITPGDARSFVKSSTVTLMAYAGAAGSVTFKADGTPISGCSNIAVAARTVAQPIESSIHDLVASCSWTTPNSAGTTSLTTVFTPSTAGYMSSTSVPVSVVIADAATMTATPTITATQAATRTPSRTLTASLTPSITPTFAGTAGPTATATRSSTSTPLPTVTAGGPTLTKTYTVTKSPTNTKSPTVTKSPTYTKSPTSTRTLTRSKTPTKTRTPTRTPRVQLP